MSPNFTSSIKEILVNYIISNLINNKNDLSKVKISLVREETSELKTFGGYVTWLKNGIYANRKHHCHKFECISKYLFPCKHLSSEGECKSQFNNLIIAVKLQR